jgi:SAM-dependent methyltransferase
VVETYRPESHPELLLQKLQAEIQRHQSASTSPSASLSVRLTHWQSQTDHINVILNAAVSKSQPRTTLPNKFRRIPLLGSRKVQRFLLKAYNFLFKEQRTVNLAMLQALQESTALNRQMLEQTAVLEEFQQQLNMMAGDRFTKADSRLVQLETQLSQITTRTVELGQYIQAAGLNTCNDAGHNLVQQHFVMLEQRMSQTELGFNELERQIASRDRQHGDQLRYLQTDLIQQKWLFNLLLEQTRHQAFNANPAAPRSLDAFPLPILQKDAMDHFYRAFEDHFRGDQDQISQRLEVYLPILQTLALQAAPLQILDVGCGRGEWLSLLRDRGYDAIGIDLSEAMLQACQARDLSVIQVDILAYLSAQPDNSLTVITGFHIVEHLRFEDLVMLMTESYRVLRSGGVMIFETPNPRNVTVGSCNFYFDPTHKNPLPPEVLQFMARYAGFEPAQILPLNPSDHPRVLEDSDLAHRFNELFYGSMDYAVIGWKE